jgi:hypothetical protein
LLRDQVEFSKIIDAQDFLYEHRDKRSQFLENVATVETGVYATASGDGEEKNLTGIHRLISKS